MKHTGKIFLILLGSSPILFAQSNWWDKLLQRKTPEGLSGAASKPLVEPHPDVLALQDSFARVAEAVKPAVVNISAVHITRVQQDPYQFFYGDPNEFFFRPRPSKPREFRSEGTGSGVLIDAEGTILTNNHVVQGADQLTVTMFDNKSFKGKVVGADPRTDLAVIRIKGTNPFSFAPLADSAKVRIGDWVLAVGSPFGLEQTVTAGIISAIRQSLNIEGKSFRNLLQTDAAINRGNSGGPLVNLRGEVVGINTAIYAPTGVFSGIGFAIPVNDAKKILKQLIEKGFVERSWIGVEIADVDEVIAQQFGLKTKEGALINQIIPGSPAAQAGLERGDVVVEFDGRKVDNVQSLQDFVSNTPPNKNLKVKVIRDGQPKIHNLKTAVMPSQQTGRPEDLGTPDEPEIGATDEWLGCTFSNITPDFRERGQLPALGVLVLEVPPQSQGAEAGLLEGDVIQAVNRVKISNLKDLAKIKSSADLKKGIIFDVVREGRSFYLSFRSLQ